MEVPIREGIKVEAKGRGSGRVGGFLRKAFGREIGQQRLRQWWQMLKGKVGNIGEERMDVVEWGNDWLGKTGADTRRQNDLGKGKEGKLSVAIKVEETNIKCFDGRVLSE
jgi:hypothetical protein